MKKNFSIIVLLSILSYAQLGNALKSLGKSLTENCSKCNTEYDTLYDYECNDIRNESQFRKCSDFVENCKCWTRAGDRIENEGRANLFQVYQNQLLEYKARVRQDSIRRESERREQAKRDSIKQESANEIYALISRGAEISLILNKCNEHEKTFSFKNSLKECDAIQDSIRSRRYITEITALLKANKLEECLDKCKEKELFSSDKESSFLITHLCEKQLIDKIKKLPKKNIKSSSLAAIYYNDKNVKQIMGYIFRDEGKMVLMTDLVWKHTVMVQYSAGYIGECRLRPNDQILFEGHAIYLGDVHTIGFGNVPNYQLLWCGN